MSSTILSTKKLSASQQELLLNAGLGFVHYNAIETPCLHAILPNDFNSYIFTSQNGLRCFLKQFPKAQKFNAFCVGEKTAQLVSEGGFEVLECTNNAKNLAKCIVKQYGQYAFLHPCGTMHREELPKILKENNVRYAQVYVYDTVLHTAHFQRKFDGVLFFSPSAVQSYVKHNDIGNSFAFCIGETTAAEAKKMTQRIVVANKPTMENVLVQSIKALGPTKKQV